MIKLLNKSYDEIGYQKSVFPGGEVHVRVYPNTEKTVIIHALPKNSEEVIELLLLKDALDREQIRVRELVLEYVPYARQDRVCNKGEAFSIKVFANLINSANFDNVILVDPHSDVAPALFKNVEVVAQERLVDVFGNTYDYIISPDGGALKKVYKVAQALNIPVIEATKVRDVSSGAITGTKVFAEPEELLGCKVLIVDDICDGGRTFIELAKVLKSKHFVAEVHLHVTHGIFSKGKDVLYKCIEEVFAVHDWTEV